MTAMRVLLLLVLVPPVAACLSSSPPAPPVRWFDPLPAAAVAAPAPPPVDLRVAAASHLGREFVVRTAPREVVFDGQHGWIDAPAQLVAAALATQVDVRPGAARLSVTVATFELDLQQEPRAVVQVEVRDEVRRRAFRTEAPAADRSPASLAAAMAQALAQLAANVADWVRGA